MICGIVQTMNALDVKDRKILYELDSNARQSLTQIGKKVGLKKNVVSYRIKRMEEQGIIKNYWTVIDAYKLGYIVFRFYLVFQYVSNEVKQQIIDYLVKEKHTGVVGSLIGQYDLSVVVWVKDINSFYRFWERLLNKYGDYFAEKTFSIYVNAHSYRRSYLLPESKRPKDRVYYETTGEGTQVDIDDGDYQLLDAIATKARKSLVDLAKELDCSSQGVSHRMKRLRNSGVIQGFRTGIDIGKLGLSYYKVDVHLKEHSKRKSLIEYVQLNPNIVFISTSAGVSDLELEFHIENPERLNQVMEEITQKFPGVIRKFSYFTVQQVHKLRNLPEL